MIDMIKEKINFQTQKDNFYTLDKEEDASLKRTENDEDPALELHHIIHQDSWKSPMLDEHNQPKLSHVKSYSWDSSAKPYGVEAEKKSLPHLLRQRESIDQNLTEPEVQVSYVMNIANETPDNRADIENAEKNNYLLTPSQFSTVGNDHERKEWTHSDQMNLLQPKNSNIREKSPEKPKSNMMGPHVVSQNGYVKKDEGVSEVEKIESEGEPSNLSLGRHSSRKSQHKVSSPGNLTPSTGKAKQLKQSKTVAFEYKGENDLAPEDIMLETNNKGVSESVPNTKKIMFHVSPDNSMQKDDRSNKPRYDRDFFNKHIVNRTGIPTITAKKREATGVLNFPNHTDANVSDRTKSMNIHLLRELASIEKQKNLKMRMEQFVLLFNKNADQGINYLISNNLVEDSPENIANALLVTEGLNKETIGELLGSHKEKNKIILKAYCQLLDFRKLEFDQALRLLLSRFKLPGEAQQIERIVNVFASVYHNDNPSVFPDEDTPFILAYSLLILNTDAHSSMVPTKNKMTKQQFIENNIKVSKTLTREYLGKMYDRITKQKFVTKADYIETIYNRLHQDNFNILQGESLKTFVDLAKELIIGAKFVKYGRKGKSHERKVWLSEKEDAVLWINTTKKNDKPRVMRVAEINDVLVGHNSTEILIKNKVPSEFDPLIVSLISSNRTLDLKAPDIETRVKWERYFRFALSFRRGDKSKGAMHGEKGNKAQDEKEKLKKQSEKEKLSEIWKVDILPHWEFHWDYEKRKPKNLEQIYDQKSLKKNSKSTKKITSSRSASSIWSIFKRKKKPMKKYEKKNSQQDMEELRPEESEQCDFDQMFKNKNLMLISLWKRGIPHWLRSTLWPISIGNQLEVTEHLYEVLQSQAKIFLNEATITKTTVFDSLKRMEQDLEELFTAFPEIKDQKEALVNILEAFIFYRPDVGYVKGMCRLVVVLLRSCPEYHAFSCFINLTHSHHFISFFRGIMREIEWRIRFFNKVFEEELPHLYAHFKALDLSSEMFLLDWFLSLFSTVIWDNDIISKIWDCFLLEGEVYAIKTGVAILKYFELDLKMETFDRAIKFLKDLPSDLDEDLLFSLIEKVNVSWQDYQDELEQQKVAEINSKVHQALLEN